MASIDVPVPERILVKIRAAGKRRWRARVTGACMTLASLFMLAATAQAAEWSSTLKGGGQVTVDPRSNRITVR